MKEDLDRRIEDTMNSFDGMRRAEANAFLYGKIRNRMQVVRDLVPQQLVWRMVIALVIVAVMNVVTLVRSNTEKQKQGAELVAKEYSISLPQEY